LLTITIPKQLLLAALALMVVLPSAGCRKKVAAAPPLVLPPSTTTVEKKVPEPAAPPALAPAKSVKPPDAVATLPPAPEPPKPKPRKPVRRAGLRAKPPEPPADHVNLPQGPPAPDPPKLGELLTSDQRRAYQQHYQNNMNAARELVAQLRTRKLSADQTDQLARVTAFLAQAETALSRDLPTASQLAERASLLAKEILRSTPQ
jgi:hypothetical protein